MHFLCYLKHTSWLKLGLISMTMWVFNHYDDPEYFQHLSLERFFFNILPTLFVLGNTRFSLPFIYFVLDKKMHYIYMSRVPSTRIASIVIHTYYTLVVLVHYIVQYYISLTMQKTLAINCRAYMHSHRLAPPPWRFLYLIFTMTLFRAIIHVPCRWLLQCDFSCFYGTRKLNQSTYTHM